MAGKLANCSVCGKLFSDTGRGICYDCQIKMQDKEKEVVEYVRHNPMSKIPEIVEATGANETLIKRLIREGRFEQVGVKMSYPCEKCGAPIIMGKICQACQDKVRAELQATQAKIVAAKQMAGGHGNAHGRGLFTTKSIQESR